MSNTYHSHPIDFNLGISIFQAMYSQGVIVENIINMQPDIINMSYYNYCYYYYTMIKNLISIPYIVENSEPTLEDAVYSFELLINNNSLSLDESWIKEIDLLLNKDRD